MISFRVLMALICAIVVFFAAIMNYREAVSSSWSNYLMFLGAIGMFIAAGLMFKAENP
jgi:hypothetical protein